MPLQGISNSGAYLIVRLSHKLCVGCSDLPELETYAPLPGGILDANQPRSTATQEALDEDDELLQQVLLLSLNESQAKVCRRCV
jgi:hypothetical protein